MADELLRVDFETPDGFDDFAFCPLVSKEQTVGRFAVALER